MVSLVEGSTAHRREIGYSKPVTAHTRGERGAFGSSAPATSKIIVSRRADEAKNNPAHEEWQRNSCVRQ